MLVMELQNFAVISLPLTSSQPINALLVSEGGIKLTLREWLRCHAHVQSKEWYDQILTEVFRFVPSCQFTITMKAVVVSTKAVVYMCLFHFGGSRVSDGCIETTRSVLQYPRNAHCLKLTVPPCGLLYIVVEILVMQFCLHRN